MELLLAVKNPPPLLHCQTLDMFVIHNVDISIGTWARTTENFTLAIVKEHLLSLTTFIWANKYPIASILTSDTSRGASLIPKDDSSPMF